MSRHAIILDTILDYWGDPWDVRQWRHSALVSIPMGWPAGQPRGKGGTGGVRVIVSQELATIMEEFPDAPLPIGKNAKHRVRRLLGLGHTLDRRAGWWDAKLKDLLTLSYQQFSKEHGVAQSTVCAQYTARFGRRIRKSGWWREPDVSEIILNRATATAADDLDLTAPTVRKLRTILLLEQKDMTTGRKSSFTPDMDAILGTEPDHVLAERFGLSKTTVATRRRKLNIASITRGHSQPGVSKRQSISLDADMKEMIDGLAPKLLERYKRMGVPLANLEPWQVIIAALRYMEESFSTGRLKP